MSKQTKKTKKNQETAVQAENRQSGATETLLTQEPTEPLNVPQTATCEELQKDCPPITQMDAESETSPPITQMDAESETSPLITQMDAENETETETEILETLEPEPVEEAVLQSRQCPRCQHVNSERGFVFPGVNRVSASGVWNGTPYQIVETRRTKCEKCGQVYFIKKYL
ncbi:MAG: hypothetical protein LBC20_03010 [Planctomycetaceae bacterium]|jgi:hypothetical protein|nr:hypothetical protein [Planctomycetaceae bacterium]